MDGREGRRPVSIDDHRGPTRERIGKSADEAGPGLCIVRPKGGATKIDRFPLVTGMLPLSNDHLPGD